MDCKTLNSRSVQFKLRINPELLPEPKVAGINFGSAVKHGFIISTAVAVGEAG